MRIKHLISFIIFIFIATQISAQSSIEEFVSIGVKQHDNGEYEKAINTYKKALEIDPKSTLVLYEIALSYMTMGDNKKAIKYADKVLDQKSDHRLEAYITKGSALDVLGKTKKSNKVFEKAIQEGFDHYLLHYNLSLNHFNTNNSEKAEHSVLEALRVNPNHSSSHLLLANIYYQRKNPVQTLLAIHYFLFLEPNTSRSTEAIVILHNSFNGNVTRDKENSNNTYIQFNGDEDNEFSESELMLSMMEATKNVEENEGKTEEQLFLENTQTFFGILGELNDESKESIWNSFYIPFFYGISQSDHMETYLKYVTQSSDKNITKWLEDNASKLSDFDTWLKAN